MEHGYRMLSWLNYIENGFILNIFIKPKHTLRLCYSNSSVDLYCSNSLLCISCIRVEFFTLGGGCHLDALIQFDMLVFFDKIFKFEKNYFKFTLSRHHHIQCIPFIETMSKVWGRKEDGNPYP